MQAVSPQQKRLFSSSASAHLGHPCSWQPAGILHGWLSSRAATACATCLSNAFMYHLLAVAMTFASPTAAILGSIRSPLSVPSCYAGSDASAQRQDSKNEDYATGKHNFCLQRQLSVKETRCIGGMPGRREVGHGMFAQRLLAPIAPHEVCTILSAF